MHHPFEPLSIPRKNPSGTQGYRVYSDAVNFKMIEAASAAEALKASGLTEAWRIERYTLMLCPVLESQIFCDVAAAPPALAAAAPVVELPPAAVAPVSEPAAQKPAENAAALSSDDVSKLLQENPPSPAASA